MTFKASESLAGHIAEHLAERIIRGELKAQERIQEAKVTQALNVSRGSVREALLMLQRRHLVDILPRRGAQVSALNADKVSGLYELMIELYVLLANAVADNWREPAQLQPLQQIQQRLRQCQQEDDITGFVEHSFAAVRAAYPFANNPYLQESVENLQPAISRSHFLALEQRRGQMGHFLEVLVALLDAVVARDKPRIRAVLDDYCRQNCQLVLAALAHG